MNGTGPPDRAQPLDLSMLQGWARAQTSCLTFLTRRVLKKDNRRAALVVGDNQAGDSHR